MAMSINSKDSFSISAQSTILQRIQSDLRTADRNYDLLNDRIQKIFQKIQQPVLTKDEYRTIQTELALMKKEVLEKESPYLSKEYKLSTLQIEQLQEQLYKLDPSLWKMNCAAYSVIFGIAASLFGYRATTAAMILYIGGGKILSSLFSKPEGMSTQSRGSV